MSILIQKNVSTPYQLKILLLLIITPFAVLFYMKHLKMLFWERVHRLHREHTHSPDEWGTPAEMEGRDRQEEEAASAWDVLQMRAIQQKWGRLATQEQGEVLKLISWVGRDQPSAREAGAGQRRQHSNRRKAGKGGARKWLWRIPSWLLRSLY